MVDTVLQQLHDELDCRRIFYLNGVEAGEQELGRGSFGVVRKGTWNGLPVSIKEIHKWILQAREECDSKELDRAVIGFQREMNIWALYTCVNPTLSSSLDYGRQQTIVSRWWWSSYTAACVTSGLQALHPAGRESCHDLPAQSRVVPPRPFHQQHSTDKQFCCRGQRLWHAQCDFKTTCRV